MIENDSKRTNIGDILSKEISSVGNDLSKNVIAEENEDLMSCGLDQINQINENLYAKNTDYTKMKLAESRTFSPKIKLPKDVRTKKDCKKGMMIKANNSINISQSEYMSVVPDIHEKHKDVGYKGKDNVLNSEYSECYIANGYADETVNLQPDKPSCKGLMQKPKFNRNEHKNGSYASDNNCQLSLSYDSKLPEVSVKSSYLAAPYDTNLSKSISNSEGEFVSYDFSKPKRKRKRIRKHKHCVLSSVEKNKVKLTEPKPLKTEAAPIAHIIFDDEDSVDKSDEDTNADSYCPASNNTTSPKCDITGITNNETSILEETLLKYPIMKGAPRKGDIVSFKVSLSLT